MEWFDALILGIVQGLAEYLPISSSGHLEIFHDLLGLDISGAESLEFDVTLHVATVLSTIVILWKEFSGICRSVLTWNRNEDFWTFWKIIVSCVPVAIVGVAFKDVVESFFGGNLNVVGTCLIITAALLTFAYVFRTRPLMERDRSVSASADAGRKINWLDAFVIGCAQALAVLPGLSRSGSTIATGIILGNKRRQVARFSFLMVIIPILGEAFLDILHGLKGSAPTGQISLLPMVVGFLASFTVGCLACKWMLNLVNRGKLVWFALYCVIVGALCLILK